MSSKSQARPVKPFTGRHMFAILFAGFGVVIAVNVTMARLAGSTFSGVVVENSYVASQHFNRWLDEAAKERQMGWSVEPVRRTDRRLALRFDHLPAGAIVTAEAWHPLGRMADITMAFDRLPSGEYVSRQTLPSGRWTLRIAVEVEGRKWRSEKAIS